MEKPNIVCIDDQREVLASLKKDLEGFKPACLIHECESSDEALELLDELDSEGEPVALLICDHIMPGKTGIDLMTQLHQDDRFRKTRKLLLTGQATHQDTIAAINQARIDRYMEKPWSPDALVQVVRELLTQFVVQSDLDYRSMTNVLDPATLYRALRERV